MSTTTTAARPPLPLPWLDHRGNFCHLRAPVFVALLLPGAWLLWQWWADALGPEPVKAALPETGIWAIRLLLLSLAITPLRWLADWPKLLYIRRQLGVATFCYACVHLGLYVAHENGDLAKAALEILRRFYLTIGFVALLGLAALAFTSTNGWMRRLGRNWKRLHRLAYPIGALALLHFFIQSKLDVSEPVLMTGLFLWLMLWRALPERWSRRPASPFLLAPAAALAAAAVEYAWCAAATRIPADQVLLANLDLTFGPRPAVWVLIATIGFALLVTLSRAATAWRRA